MRCAASHVARYARPTIDSPHWQATATLWRSPLSVGQAARWWSTSLWHEGRSWPLASSSYSSGCRRFQSTSIAIPGRQTEKEVDKLAPGQDYDTIFAPATPAGKSAICVIRISGPRVRTVYEAMCHSRRHKAASTIGHSYWPPPSRVAQLTSISKPKSDTSNLTTSSEKIDKGLVLYFPAKTSLTGQDMLEFHLHGSTAVMKAALLALGSIKGVRPAEPGEFTKLAFESGKMDLMEVEGLRDLIESETEAQRRLAMRQTGGQMAEAYAAMRKDIIGAMSVVEAVIDFGEDAAIDLGALESARTKLQALREKISLHLSKSKNAEIIRSGIRLAVFGAPNAGKSSFTNWLAQREASIVTAHPGTTRDVVELSLDLGGYPVILSDTAGLRAASDEVEQIGVERAKAVVQEADLKLCIISMPEALAKMQEVDQSGTILDPLTASLVDANTLFLLNKSDAIDPNDLASKVAKITQHLYSNSAPSADTSLSERIRVVSLSQQTGLDGVSSMLQDTIATRFDDFTSSNETLLVTRERHRYHMQDCLDCLDRAIHLSQIGTLHEQEQDHWLVDLAEELRFAAQALGRVTGEIDVEEVLDELFGSFCIGK